MKQDKQAVCPGCSRHCPMGKARCGYGRRYFAAQAGEDAPQKTYKWEKHVQRSGPVWQLLMTAKRVKKGLCSKSITEEALLGALDETQRLQLAELLRTLDAAAAPKRQKTTT